MADPLASLARAMEVVPDSEMEVAPVSSSEVLPDSEMLLPPKRRRRGAMRGPTKLRRHEAMRGITKRWRRQLVRCGYEERSDGVTAPWSHC